MTEHLQVRGSSSSDRSLQLGIVCPLFAQLGLSTQARAFLCLICHHYQSPISCPTHRCGSRSNYKLLISIIRSKNKIPVPLFKVSDQARLTLGVLKPLWSVRYFKFPFRFFDRWIVWWEIPRNYFRIECLSPFKGRHLVCGAHHSICVTQTFHLIRCDTPFLTNS